MAGRLLEKSQMQYLVSRDYIFGLTAKGETKYNFRCTSLSPLVVNFKRLAYIVY